MKKYLIIIGICAALASCSKKGLLDNQTSALDVTQTFSDSLRTIQFLGGIYGDIGFVFNKQRWDTHGNTEHSTDDAEYSLSGTSRPDVILYNGTVSPTNYGTTTPTLADYWTVPYTNIRRCNLLLQQMSNTPLSEFRKSRMRGEARCLRAWYYMQLLIVYGGVPNVGDNVYDIEANVNVPRSNFDSLVTYLSNELDAAAQLLPSPTATSLPDGWDAIDYGRVTKGTCMGLKSRLLLYAASPLFNGGANTTDANVAKIVSYPTYNVSYWQAAADAALAVINSGYYSLYVDNTTQAGYGFYKMFLTRVNSEIIFGKYRPSNKDFEYYYNPPTRSGANYTRATQNIVDAFPMINGKAITDATSGYNAQNPYVNRDPRFRYTIIYNGSKYATNTNVQDYVWTFNNLPASTATTYQTSDAYSASANTGLYVRKMCDSTVSYGGSAAGPDRTWPLMRYAEILLNYAEAINEVGQTSLAYDKLKMIRDRAGITPGTDGLYGMKANMTQAEMRTFIQNERHIELAYEDHRYNDIRRWKIAMTLYNGGPTGYNGVMHVTRTGGTTPATFTFSYAVEYSIRLHTFRPEMYLLPIQQTEISKAPAMIQNPGW